MFRIAASALALLAAAANAASGVYDYDHVDNWNADFASPNGECDGMKQSPIALESMDCTTYANYEMKVSVDNPFHIEIEVFTFKTH